MYLLFFVVFFVQTAQSVVDSFFQCKQIRRFSASVVQFDNVSHHLEQGQWLSLPLSHIAWSKDFFLEFCLDLDQALYPSYRMIFSGRFFDGCFVLFLNGRPLYVADSFLLSDQDLVAQLKDVLPSLVSIEQNSSSQTLRLKFRSDVKISFTVSPQSYQLEQKFIALFNEGHVQVQSRSVMAPKESIDEIKKEIEGLDRIREDFNQDSYFLSYFQLFSHCLIGKEQYPSYILDLLFSRMEPYLPSELKIKDYSKWRLWLLKDKEAILDRIPFFQRRQEQEWLFVLDQCLSKWIQVTHLVHNQDREYVVRIQKENRDKVLAFLNELKEHFFSLKSCSGNLIRRWTHISKAVTYQAKVHKDPYFEKLYQLLLSIEHFSWQEDVCIEKKAFFSMIEWIHNISVLSIENLDQLGHIENLSSFFKRTLRDCFVNLPPSLPFKKDLFVSFQMTTLQVSWNADISEIRCYQFGPTHFVYEIPYSFQKLSQELGDYSLYSLLAFHTLFLYMQKYSMDSFFQYVYLHIYLMSSMEQWVDFYQHPLFVKSVRLSRKKQMFFSLDNNFFQSSYDAVYHSFSFAWMLLTQNYFVDSV